MKKFLLVINFFICLLLVSCSKIEEYKGRTLFLFDTTVTIKLYNDSDAEKHYQEIKEMLTEISNVSSNFESYDGKSVYDLNIKRKIEANSYLELAEMLSFAKSAYLYTDGYFNPFIGRITSMWKKASEDKVLPSDEKIKEELVIMNNTNLTVSDDMRYVELHGDGDIDLGGFVKGYACYKLIKYVKDNDIKNFLFDLGNSNILFGKKVDQSFSFGLKKPTEEGYFAEGKITDIIISTSSIEYQRFEIDGKEYNHLISPFTGYPVEYYTSASIFYNYDDIDKDVNSYSDALSTAIFCMPIEFAKDYAKKVNIGIILYNKEILYKSDELDYVKAL